MITRTITARVRIGGIVEGNPPMLAFSEMVARPDGKRKLFSQMAQVTDADLLARLRQAALNGEEADVVLETRLSTEDLSTVLKDFSVIHVAAVATA